MSSKDTAILEHAATNGFNVLLIGNHGVGKTAMVKSVFDKLGWTWKYFSASTIDPWVDLVGVPKEKDGVLELVRPADLAFDEVEAFFFDEYNRAPKKVRNAVMEVIQFGSINGKKFPNLKVVFAAINPDDDEEISYDVEKLDAAQVDRFHIKLPIKNEPCPYFFKDAYGAKGSLAVKWWKDQTDDVKKMVSPRNLEAALQVFVSGGDPTYCFVDPTKVNVGEFCEYIDKPDPIQLLDEACKMTPEEKSKFLRDNNNLKHVRTDLVGKERYLKELAPYMPEMEMMKELRDSKGNKVITHVVANVANFTHLIPIVLSNAQAYSGRVVDAFKRYQESNGQDASLVNSNREVNIKGKKVRVSSMNICFTGKLVGYNRDQAEDLMKSYGAEISSAVSFKTTHLVVGDKIGATKIKKAKDQGVEILTQDEFYKVIQELNSPA